MKSGEADMKVVMEKNGIHIDITNKCVFSCSNCYKFVGHISRPYFMKLETVKKAIDSLDGYQGQIVISGGEPTLHPDFVGICRYLRKKVPPDQRYLQTTGHKWCDYKSDIKKSFSGRVSINDHTDGTQKYQPMLVAIEDVVTDVPLRNSLIDKCWVKERWSAVINSKGCFSCEIAGAFDVLYNGPGGLPIEKGWWAKDHKHFKKQMEKYCRRCGAALPQPAVSAKDKKDSISYSHFRALENLQTPKFQKNRVLLVEKKYSVQDINKIAKTWKPWKINKGAKGAGKNIFQQYAKMIRIFLKRRVWLRYGYTKLRKFVIHAWRLLWRLSKKVDFCKINLFPLNKVRGFSGRERIG
jgi:Radical SAM superfamily/4Fe-4S single cluster domain